MRVLILGIIADHYADIEKQSTVKNGYVFLLYSLSFSQSFSSHRLKRTT